MGRKVALIAAFTALAALAVFTFGGGPAVAHDNHEATGEVLHTDCTWSVDKTVNHHLDITLLEGAEPFTVAYTITLRATCTDSHHALDGSHHATDGHLDGAPNHGTDLCVQIADPDAPAGTFGPTGSVCVTQSRTFVTGYPRTLGPFECGDHSVTDTVTVTNPAGEVLAQDSVTINVHVLCDHGCTLTQGYWKTHSDRGPATPFDATWNLLPDVDGDTVAEQESENFFLSGQTWYQVFWTSPSGGNVYYILAHQYMAAVLNMLGGASSTTAVDLAIADAATFFSTYTPAQAGALKKSGSVRADALADATTLEQYNRGVIGPGHCDDDHNTSGLN